MNSQPKARIEMKAKNTKTGTDHQVIAQGAACTRNAAAIPPAFILRFPLAVNPGSDRKASRTVFEKTVNGQRFTVVQTVVVNSQARTQTATPVLARQPADWPSIPATTQAKQWLH